LTEGAGLYENKPEAVNAHNKISADTFEIFRILTNLLKNVKRNV